MTTILFIISLLCILLAGVALHNEKKYIGISLMLITLVILAAI